MNPPAITRLHPAELTDQTLDAAVVIDVLRATTTAVALFDRGVTTVRVVATPDELRGLPPPPDGQRYQVFSELDASGDAGFDRCDNSPARALDLDLAGRLPVLVTTNGTRAIAAAVERASVVLVGTFCNLTATARHLLASGRAVTLLAAGDFAGRDVRTEDERCADAFEATLRGGAPDLARLLAACRDDARLQRRLARTPDLAHDVDIAFDVDRFPVVVGARRGVAGLELVQIA
ncbi:MAG TPA: 2-phosphosulfolactate phosphatase [Kofleriaceae bacterium]|nr:2-phosphosulfolactate phosphatase [Kofleriaceae bacterium]